MYDHDGHVLNELCGDLPGESKEQWREWALIYMNNDFGGDLLGHWLDLWFEED